MAFALSWEFKILASTFVQTFLLQPLHRVEQMRLLLKMQNEFHNEQAVSSRSPILSLHPYGPLTLDAAVSRSVLDISNYLLVWLTTWVGRKHRSLIPHPPVPISFRLDNQRRTGAVRNPQGSPKKRRARYHVKITGDPKMGSRCWGAPRWSRFGVP